MSDLPVVLVAASGVGLGYLAGVRRCAGRTPSWRLGARRMGRWRVVAFLTGLALLAVALSPWVHEAAESRFWAHMGQHVLLMVGAAPLLAAGNAGLALLLVLPVRARARLARWRSRIRTAPGVRLLLLPLTLWLVSVATLWVWHLPVCFDAALGSPPLHELEHLSLLAAAWAFWWHVLRAGRRRMNGALGVLYVFAATAPAAALGAVLTFASLPLYPAQAAAAASSGFDPLVDQQLAGLVMWVPTDVVYLAASVALFLSWLTPLTGPQDSSVLPSAVTAPRRIDLEEAR